MCFLRTRANLLPVEAISSVKLPYNAARIIRETMADSGERIIRLPRATSRRRNKFCHFFHENLVHSPLNIFLKIHPEFFILRDIIEFVSMILHVLSFLSITRSYINSIRNPLPISNIIPLSHPMEYSRQNILPGISTRNSGKFPRI